jgi:uncharacterized lipoprotein YehR (DUF1307 family)
MKHLIFTILIAAIMTACGNKKETNKFLGSYTNDTITFIFKNKNMCDVITVEQTMQNCDYSFDVDMKNICVVDANQNIYLLEIKKDSLTTPSGSTFKKIK